MHMPVHMISAPDPSAVVSWIARPWVAVLLTVALVLVVMLSRWALRARRAKRDNRRARAVSAPYLKDVTDSWSFVASNDVPLLAEALRKNPRDRRANRVVAALIAQTDLDFWNNFLTWQGPLVETWADPFSRNSLLTKVLGGEVDDAPLWGFVAAPDTRRVGVVLGETHHECGVIGPEVVTRARELGVVLGTARLCVEYLRPGVVVVSWPVDLPDPQ